MAKLIRTSRLAAVILAYVTMLCAQDAKPSEYRVKAVFLYNFGRFVVWPPAPKSDSFAICVLGQDPFGPALDATVAGETIDHAKVVARRISKPQDAGSCRILFISSSEDGQMKEILAGLDQTSILTVSDVPQFTRRGGMVQFILDGNKVRFEVNLLAVQRARLSLSSELLKLAISARRNP
jgi:hypothetical protein